MKKKIVILMLFIMLIYVVGCGQKENSLDVEQSEELSDENLDVEKSEIYETTDVKNDELDDEDNSVQQEEDEVTYEYVDAPIYQKVTAKEAQDITKEVLDSGAQKVLKLALFDSITIDGVTYSMESYENGDVVDFMVELNKQLAIDLGNGKKKNQSHKDFIDSIEDDERGDIELEFKYQLDGVEGSDDNYISIALVRAIPGVNMNAYDYLLCNMEIACPNSLNKVYTNYDEEQLSVTLEGTSLNYAEVYYGNTSEIYQASIRGLKEDSSMLEKINNIHFPDIIVNGERMCPFRTLETAKEYVNIVPPQEKQITPDRIEEELRNFDGWYGLHEDGTPCSNIIYKWLFTANTSGEFMDRVVFDGIWLLPGNCDGCTNDIKINGVSIKDDIYLSELLPAVDTLGEAKIDKKNYLTRDNIELEEYPGIFEITYEVSTEKVDIISYSVGSRFLQEVMQRDDSFGTNQTERFLREQFTDFYNIP